MNLAILLSTYNGEKYLSRQLDSILNQSFKNFTLYVRDDFSSDSTKLIIQEYQSKYNNIILIDDLNINIGANKSFYFLLNKVQADYYMFCDQDDIWLDNKLQIQIEEIKKIKMLQSKPVVIFHDLSLMNSKGDLIYNSLFNHKKIKIDDVTFESLFVKNIITGCTCIINNSMRDEMLKISPNKIWFEKRSSRSRCDLRQYSTAPSIGLLAYHMANISGLSICDNSLSKFL